jgi:hypothetical protein
VKVYVAGLNMVRAREVMGLLRGRGCEITYDWTAAYSEADEKQTALLERQGVRDADAVVYLWERDQESARYEAGMAMGLGKPLVVVGHQSFFFGLPEVRCVAADAQIIGALGLD